MEEETFFCRVAAVGRVFEGELGAGVVAFGEDGARALHDEVGAIELLLPFSLLRSW